MGRQLISKKTQYVFREHLVGWTLREIEMEFSAAGIECTAAEDPTVGGQRRSLVDQYYRSMELTDWNDVRKLLSVYENILLRAYKEHPEKATELTGWLAKDGFMYRDGRLTSAAHPLLGQAKAIAVDFNADHMAQQIKRMQEAVDDDPCLAIGSAKELVETCCKTILAERGKPLEGSPDIPKLTKAVLKDLGLVPEDIPEHAKGAEIIKRLLSNLATVVQGLAELRGLYGTGHGQDGKARGVQPRHAKLAVGAAATLAVFLFETHHATSEQQEE